VKNIFIGTSGYVYPHWKGIFYPADLPSHKWIEFYAKRFNTVEVNATFYRIPKLETVKSWSRRVPENFRYTVKANRHITHIYRLKERECSETLKRIFQTLEPIKERIGCVLYQLPPSLHRDVSLLESFCARIKEDYPDFRHAFEFRNNTWLEEDVFNVLREFGVCYVLVSAPKQEYREVTTTSFSYIRLHGVTDWYSYDYSEDELKFWAKTAKKLLKESEELFIYFNNDTNAYAVKNALRLKELLNG